MNRPARYSYIYIKNVSKATSKSRLLDDLRGFFGDYQLLKPVKLKQSNCVVSLEVRMGAFQAFDPGSSPGRRIFLSKLPFQETVKTLTTF